MSGVRKLVAEVGQLAALDEKHLFDLQLAVGEACVNAVEHTGEEALVVAWLLPDRIIIEISSVGGFEPKRRADDFSFSRGLGLTLMASLADQMQVVRLTDDRTRVSLTFLLEPAAEEESSAGDDPVSFSREMRRARRLQDPRVHGVVLTPREMRKRKNLEAQLRDQAFHDPLTGLANRALFLDRVENAIQRARRESVRVAVALIDLDEFKEVNDTLGHLAGDSLLVMVGARLRGVLRAEDTAARLGGDEFAVLIPDARSLADVESAAERILAELREPYDLGDTWSSATASIGVAASGLGTTCVTDLLRHADIALYATKAQGRDGWTLFQPEMERALGA